MGFGLDVRGLLLGPALGGLLGNIDVRLPFWVAAASVFANALYGAIVMPESLAKDRRASFRLRQGEPDRRASLLAARRAVASLAVVYAMLLLAAQCMPNTIVLYTDYRFGWSAARSARTSRLSVSPTCSCRRSF